MIHGRLIVASIHFSAYGRIASVLANPVKHQLAGIITGRNGDLHGYRACGLHRLGSRFQVNVVEHELIYHTTDCSMGHVILCSIFFLNYFQDDSRTAYISCNTDSGLSALKSCAAGGAAGSAAGIIIVVIHISLQVIPVVFIHLIQRIPVHFQSGFYRIIAHYVYSGVHFALIIFVVIIWQREFKNPLAVFGRNQLGFLIIPVLIIIEIVQVSGNAAGSHLFGD